MNSPGAVIGEWTLLEYIPGQSKAPRRDPKWLCRCSCGVERDVRPDNLRAGVSTSCGHDLPEKMSEGMRRYHDMREQRQSPVTHAPTGSPWEILRRYQTA